jgi:phosphoribosylamine--glycine ligase
VVGGGAREHALVWKAVQSPRTRSVYCAPGNAGTAAIAVNVPIAADDVAGLCRLVREREIDLTVIGPETAIASGLADEIAANGRLVFGPTKAAGQIEASKVFAKTLMQKLGVPTPPFRVFEDAAAAKDYVRGEGRAFVVKADGLAKGKGTLVPRDTAETLEAIDQLMVARTVGAAAARILLEEPITGREVSLLAFVDGTRVVPMVPACDYKRALDGDHGPNTGGMGAYSPPGFFTTADVEAMRTKVFQPVVNSLREAGTPYRGCLYAGLMMTADGIQVLEFNARFGDPEAQVVLPRVDGDLVPALQAAARGELSDDLVRWSSRATVGVVLAARGYPGHYASGAPISGLFRLERDVLAFHAGTISSPDGYRTAGGRVVTLVAVADSLPAARELAYRNVERVQFEGMTYRTDIARREAHVPELLPSSPGEVHNSSPPRQRLSPPPAEG